jgi:hypothetical protein
MCALVRGMTDILTPVNILPNAQFDFRDAKNFPRNFSILGQRGTWTDEGSAYVSRGVLRIKGKFTPDVSSSSGSASYIRLACSTAFLENGTTISGEAKLNTASDYILSFGSSVSGTAALLVGIFNNPKDLNTNDYVEATACFANPKGTNYYTIMYTIAPKSYTAGVAIPIDVTIRNLRVFRGKFENPPSDVPSFDDYTKSLFVMANSGSILHEALLNMSYGYSVNTYNLSQAPGLPLFQSIHGPKNTLNPTKVYLGLLQPTNNNAKNNKSTVHIRARLYLVPSHGSSTDSEAAVFDIKVIVKFGTTNAIVNTCTRNTTEGNSRHNCTIGCDQVSGTYGYTVKPYLTITSDYNNCSLLGYMVYSCFTSGHSVTCRIPATVDETTLV